MRLSARTRNELSRLQDTMIFDLTVKREYSWSLPEFENAVEVILVFILVREPDFVRSDKEGRALAIFRGLCLDFARPAPVAPSSPVDACRLGCRQ